MRIQVAHEMSLEWVLLNSSSYFQKNLPYSPWVQMFACLASSGFPLAEGVMIAAPAASSCLPGPEPQFCGLCSEAWGGVVHSVKG